VRRRCSRRGDARDVAVVCGDRGAVDLDDIQLRIRALQFCLRIFSSGDHERGRTRGDDRHRYYGWAALPCQPGEPHAVKLRARMGMGVAHD